MLAVPGVTDRLVTVCRTFIEIFNWTPPELARTEWMPARWNVNVASFPVCTRVAAGPVGEETTDQVKSGCVSKS